MLKKLYYYMCTVAADRGESGSENRVSHRARKLQQRNSTEAKLDKALEDSFPASDPVAISRPGHATEKVDA